MASLKIKFKIVTVVILRMLINILKRIVRFVLLIPFYSLIRLIDFLLFKVSFSAWLIIHRELNRPYPKSKEYINFYEPLQSRRVENFVKKMRKHYISVSGGEDTATYNPLEEFTLAAIMTTFNQPKSELERCFRSLLEQELKLNEIIIFDGGSRTDETLNWLDSLAYLNAPEVKVIRGESLDIIETRNRAAKLSNSTFITFVDPDDYFELNHFKLIHNAVKKRLSLDLVFSDVVVRNQLGEILTVNQTGPADFLLLLEHNRLPICSTIRRDFFLTIGGYRKEMEKGCEDWDLWVRAAAHGANSMHVPFASFNYTEKTEGNRSSELKAFNEAQELKLRKFALNLIEELLND